ncbi:MAG: histone deacetylase family protein [Candidatus Aenigmatarchaeota archaeon]
MKIVHSPQCLEFGQSGHPESPERVRKAAEFLRSKDYNFAEPEPCSEEDLLCVHSRELVEKVREGNFYDPDSPGYEDIYKYARLSAGGAVKAAEVKGFSLMRPPGHHATTNSFGGFCYFNNIAVAVRKLGKRTLIVDVDRHHGNGTQEIFKGSDRVEYVSLHGAGYPGTGRSSTENCYNHLFTSPVNDEEYLAALDEILSTTGEFELVAVSAGFDGYKNDPLASQIRLSKDCYEKIGERIGELGAPVFCILEGGYAADDLGEMIYQFLDGLV